MDYVDYYQALGLSRSATADEIKRAYRKLSRQYHPDLNKSAGAEDKSDVIAEAYEVLGDADNRKKYDKYGSAWLRTKMVLSHSGFEGFDFSNVNFGQGRRGSVVQVGKAGRFFETFFGGGGADIFGGMGGNPGGFPGGGGRQEAAPVKITKSA